jgi:rhodanese-related sulfurtransferase
MKTLLAALVAILLAGTFLSVSAVSAQDEPADPALAAAVPPQMVAPADVLKMIGDKRVDIAIVDTQPADGYAEQHIPGAINYPWVMQIKNFPIPLPRNKVLIFYGSCPNDTSDIVKKLAEFGYFNTKIMDGGLDKWIALKYPVVGAGSGRQATPDLSQVTAKPAKNDSLTSQ